MDLRPVACALLVLLAALAAPHVEPPDGAAARPPDRAAPDLPNVVLVLVDDMRWDEMRFLPRTRRALGDHGVTYTRAISPHPLCCPARAELFTGQYAQNNGVQHNAGPWGAYQALRRPDDNLGHWLQRAGYSTAFFGKFLNGYRHADGRIDGWDRWDPLVRDIYAYRKSTWFNGDRYHRYTTSVLARRSLQYVDRVAGRRPFFLYLNHIAPHEAPKGTYPDDPDRQGWGPPKYQRRYADTYRRLVPPMMSTPTFNEKDVADLPTDLQHDPVWRQGMITYARARARSLRTVDDTVARLLGRLRRAGELADTYVVLASDNSFHLGEHRLRGKNFPFDESLRVPLLVRGPGIAPGTRVRTPVSLVDLPATILRWAHARPGRRIDGLPLDRAGDRDTILVQTGDAVRDRTPGWDYRGVSTRRYLYAIRTDTAQGVLFDRRRDPMALRNRFRAPAYAPVHRALQRRLRALMDCSGRDSCNRDFGRLPRPRRIP